MKEWKALMFDHGADPWDLSLAVNAYYECPKDAQGKRLGPLVPYSGKDDQQRNLVGDVYYNFAMVEEHQYLVRYFATILCNQYHFLRLARDATTIVGIPDGGRSFGSHIAEILRKRFVYPAKVPRPKSANATKEEYDLIFKRSELSASDIVLVADDVQNNFFQTDGCLESIVKTGARVIGLCSVLNRSPHVDKIYVPKEGAMKGIQLPVMSTIRKACPEYNQDDQEVAEDMAQGNIEWKAKNNWSRLRNAMDDHPKR